MSGGVRGDASKRAAEDERLAAEFDQARGYDLPREERSRIARELSVGAPVIRWPADQLAVLEAAADAAYERFMAAASYYSAASDAHVAASSALAAALIEHQEKP